MFTGDTVQDSLKILESVNTFYSQSFGQLINITVAVLAFAGIVLPILITLYQKRLFKLEHQAIQNTLATEMESRLEEGIKEIKAEYEQKEAEFEDKISKMKESLKKDLDATKGGICHVQGNNELKQELLLMAFDSFVSASFSYVKAEDNLNLRRVLGLIDEKCLPKFPKTVIEEHDESFKSFEKLLEKIREYDNNGTFVDLVQSLNKTYNTAKKRQPSKSVAK